ncbi:vesicle-associated membrane protein putative syntaxin-like protein [Leptomonas seymouri]|uniref:Vesicle-associated membrane protein putative syntaxin-like protein n=1 Tax=Leptomonas seymouri TaxID=5684 RepID=A0A0N1I246_LEPSE|nr:vesicle-associated membrane protein putative syntaxin-like protein [Leptomonas seymouri]|eukprot:KPI85450.1 vesicle-associated membrane protein putative syntaxin-like protein [Leptomonas seymouri]
MEDTELTVRDRYCEFAERRAAARTKYGHSQLAELKQSKQPLIFAPLWSILPADFEDSALTLTQEIEKLNELHRTFLKPKFRSDEEEKNLRAEIGQQTVEIQSFLKKLEHILVAGTQNKPTYSEEESRIVRNIQVHLSTRFKQLTAEFKATQERFGTQLRRLEQKSSKYMKIGSDAAYEKVKREEKTAHFLEMGFSEQDVEPLLLEDMCHEQTSKEIKEILDSIQEIHSMFEDVHNMVVEQGTMLDRIDYNVDKALISASKAQIELERTRERQESCTFM